MEQELLEAFIFVNLPVTLRHRPFDAAVEVINRFQAMDHFERQSNIKKTFIYIASVIH